MSDEHIYFKLSKEAHGVEIPLCPHCKVQTVLIPSYLLRRVIDYCLVCNVGYGRELTADAEAYATITIEKDDGEP